MPVQIISFLTVQPTNSNYIRQFYFNAQMQRRQSGPQPIPSRRGFPSQLYAMLEEVEVDGMTHVVSWQPHGRAFKVHRREQFVEHVLPMYVCASHWQTESFR
jgi:HSF-type DNA-binding